MEGSLPYNPEPNRNTETNQITKPLPFIPEIYPNTMPDDMRIKLEQRRKGSGSGSFTGSDGNKYG